MRPRTPTLAREVLEGVPGPRRDVVVLNAAAALVVSGRAGDLKDGAQRAARALDSGAAAGLLRRVTEVSRA